MHFIPPKTSLRARLRTLSDLVPSPLTAVLAVISIAIVIAVVIVTVSHRRLPASGPVELICAFVLAAVAVAEASRPARSERMRRRMRPAPHSSREASDVDAPIVAHWH